MTYLPIILMLLDKVTCLTSALFLLLSSFISLFIFWSRRAGVRVGSGGVGWGRWEGRDSALYILIFSVRRTTHTVPAVENNRSQARHLLKKSTK